MFERFTERARQVVVLAQEETRTLKHPYIDVEHLLLGLLREEEGLAARALSSCGFEVDDVRARINRLTADLPKNEGVGQIPFTPAAKKALERALREALELGHNYIGTEHVLLGLIRETEGLDEKTPSVTRQVFQDLGCEPEKVRVTVLELLGHPGYSVPAKEGVTRFSEEILKRIGKTIETDGETADVKLTSELAFTIAIPGNNPELAHRICAQCAKQGWEASYDPSSGTVHIS